MMDQRIATTPCAHGAYISGSGSGSSAHLAVNYGMLAEDNDLPGSRNHEGWHHWAGELARRLLKMRLVAVGMRRGHAISVGSAICGRHGC